ncbi:MAG: hypothetical protein RL722_1634, partial [Pseudomonadota bacterium]
IDAGRYVDYVELDAASNRGVDEISALLDQAVYKPVMGRFKVYMIDEVHMMTSHAFNAMLKTLEEPPDYLKFVLATTDPQKVPVTVLSRCLQFNLRPMAPETIAEHLQQVLAAEAIAADAGALRLVARSARGSMRDALSLTDQAIAFGAGRLDEAEVRRMLGAVDRSHVQRMVRAIAAADGAGLVAAVDDLRKLGLSATGTLEELAGFTQQMALAQAVPGALDPTDPDSAAARELGAALPADETQLLYSIALHGRAELGLAPDEYSGLLMVLLRALAFRPPGLPRAVMAPAAGPASGGHGSHGGSADGSARGPQGGPGAGSTVGSSASAPEAPSASAPGEAAASGPVLAPASPPAIPPAIQSVIPPAIPPAISSAIPPAPPPALTAAAAPAPAPVTPPVMPSAATTSAPLPRPPAPVPAALLASEPAVPAERVVPSTALTTAADEPPWLDEEPLLAEPDGSAAYADQEGAAPWDDAALAAPATPPAHRAARPAQQGQPAAPSLRPIRPAAQPPGRDRAPVAAAGASSLPASTPAPASPTSAPGLALGAASAASALPHEPNETTSRWLAWLEPVLAAGKLNGLVRELAVQAEAVHCPAPADLDAAAYLAVSLVVGRESLRQAAMRDRLQAALAEVHGRPVQIETRPGAVRDSASLRDGAAKARRQSEAEALVADHPQVRALLQHFPGAFVVPGSIRPTN